jgi:hypothetical protein
MIAAKIDAAPIPEADKPGLKQRLASLSEAALRAATTDLIKSGLDHLSDVVHWLRGIGGV